MRIPNKPPDTTRMARAQAELARVEARLKRDALKADVIARIVSDTAKNKDVLDRPAVFAALTEDADSMMELARQAGWLAEETPVTGTEMHRAGTLLGSLLNAFQVPSEQTEVVSTRQARTVDSVRPESKRQRPEELTVNVSQTPNAVPVENSLKAVRATPLVPQQNSALTKGWEGTGFHAPFDLPAQSLKTASPALFIMLALFGAGFFVWLFL